MIKVEIKKKLKPEIDKNVTYLSKSSNFNTFFILDDKTKIDKKEFKKIIKKIESYGYKVTIITMKNISKLVLNHLKKYQIDSFDSVILLGEGGTKFFSFFKNCPIFKSKKIIELKWSRSWFRDEANYFDTNIDEFILNNKKIIIFEDVIASGETILNINDYLSKNNNVVVSLITCLIQESSPLYKNSFCNTIVGNVIEKVVDSSGLDPFWYPPIYSLRHLVYGDEEMPDFYDILNKKYFNNEDCVEKLIKEMRN